MKKVFLILILAVISISLIAIIYPDYSTPNRNPSASGFIKNNSDDGITDAAKSELNKFLNLIPVGFEESYGFDKRGDFLKAEIGIPFRIYTLKTGFLKDSETDLKKFIYPLDEWRVPILVNNRMVSLLTVVKENDLYHCVDLGGSALASELNNYEIYFDKYSKIHALLRLYQIQCDILLIYNKNIEATEGDCYPLSFTQKVFKENSFTTQGPDKFDVISPIIISAYLKSLNLNK